MSYSKKRFFLFLSLGLTILIAAGLLSYYFISRGIRNFELNSINLIFIIGIVLGLLFSWFLNFMKKLGDNMGLNTRWALMGWRGEERALKKLKEILQKENYKIYPNFKLPQTKFDIDALVVNNKGLFIFEIKNISGSFKIVKDKFYREQRCNGNRCTCELNKWQNPIDEITRHELALKNYLEGFGIQINPKKAILLVGNSRIIDLEDPSVFIVKNLDELKKYIDDSYINPSFNEEFCLKLNKILSSV